MSDRSGFVLRNQLHTIPSITAFPPGIQCACSSPRSIVILTPPAARPCARESSWSCWPGGGWIAGCSRQDPRPRAGNAARRGAGHAGACRRAVPGAIGTGQSGGGGGRLGCERRSGDGHAGGLQPRRAAAPDRGDKEQFPFMVDVWRVLGSQRPGPWPIHVGHPPCLNLPERRPESSAIT